MHGVFLAALRPAVLVERVKLHNPARQVDILSAFYRKAEALTAYPGDAALLPGWQIIVAGSLALAQHIPGDAGNPFADDNARNHQSAITRDIAALIRSITLSSASSW